MATLSCKSMEHSHQGGLCYPGGGGGVYGCRIIHNNYLIIQGREFLRTIVTAYLESEDIPNPFTENIPGIT